ncbi:MAG TPA: transglutaminase-like domain-containing protein [Actinospica sp.]|nr:transglutaminase-like domain-containing protein [Actinospica sp.]
MTVARLHPTETEYYTRQSVFSDPGELARRYEPLPAEPRALAHIVRGLMIHRLEGELLGFAIPDDRMRDDAETRYIDEILKLIVLRSDKPLAEPREPADRFVGICRDFSLLLCSLLRAKRIPARIRSGFADYFGDGTFHHDHVVTEYWDDERGWLLADAEVTAVHTVDFDPLDVPRDRFLVAGKAWQRIRAGEADPKTFGLQLPDGGLLGEWFVAGNIRLDLAAVNKVETLLWDIWGLGAGADGDMTDEIYDLYDLAARVAEDEIVFDAARTLFTENAGLRTPATVLSLAPFNGPHEVALRR